LKKSDIPRDIEFYGSTSAFNPEALAPHNTTDGPAIEWTPENKCKVDALAAPMMRALGCPR